MAAIKDRDIAARVTVTLMASAMRIFGVVADHD